MRSTSTFPIPTPIWNNCVTELGPVAPAYGISRTLGEAATPNRMLITVSSVFR